jgi:hypothetical protein
VKAFAEPDAAFEAAQPVRDRRRHILERRRDSPGFGLAGHLQSARIRSKLLLEDLDIEPRWSTSSELAMEDGMMQVAS